MSQPRSKDKTGAYQFETDPIVLCRRQKQIDYGKATVGYQNYLHNVPKESRSPQQPQTPNKYRKCSRRTWDGSIKVWRLLLHAYDPDRMTSSADNSVHSEYSEAADTSKSDVSF